MSNSVKLTKTSRLLIIIGIPLIILASLGLVYAQQIREQNQLDDKPVQARLKLTELQIEQLSSQKAELEKQLSQTISKVETTRTTFSEQIETVTIIDTLLDVAVAKSVEVVELTFSETASKQAGNGSIRTISAKVSGDISNLVSFISVLNGRFTTGMVESLTINVPETTNEKASANIKLVVYNYGGTNDG